MSSDSLVHAVAGAAGGVVAMTFTYPLIFISTRAAVETSGEQKSAVDAALDIVEREGVLGLYTGLGSSLLGIAVTNGSYYLFYERSRTAVLNNRGGSRALTTPESMLIGLIAGSATAIISNPIWVVQATQAVRTMPTNGDSTAVPPPRKLSMWETVQHIQRKDGIGAFWRGIGPALALVVNPIIQYTVFEQLKNLVVRRRTERLRASGSKLSAALTDVDFFLLGAISKLVATGSTYPYIVIKSRMQAGNTQSLQHKTTFEGVLSILRNEGIQGLYRGMPSKLVQSVLTAAILFAGQRRFYELAKLALSSSSKTPLKKV